MDGVFDSERKIAVAPLGGHRHRILRNEEKDDRLSTYPEGGLKQALSRSDDRHARIKKNEQQHEAAHKSTEDNPYQRLPGRLTSILEVPD
jgi:hypothetical protein